MDAQEREACLEGLEGSGHRLTPQRREVYDVLVSGRDHPTATEVFMRAKGRIPTISLATVYNCLETLVGCGLVKQVNVEREATRYCPNLEEHGHFVCDRCHKVFDVPLTAKSGRAWKLPDGFTVSGVDITLRGICPDCNT